MTSIQQVRLRPGESARSRRLAHEIKRSVGILLAMLLAVSGLAVASTSTASADTTSARTWIEGGNTFYAYTAAGETLDVNFSPFNIKTVDANFEGGGQQARNDVRPGITVNVTAPDGTVSTCDIANGAKVADVNAFDGDATNLPAAHGVNVCDGGDLSSSTAGVWQIDITRGDTGETKTAIKWDITAKSAGTAVNGRVWADRYAGTSYGRGGVDGQGWTAGMFDLSLWFVGENGYIYGATYKDFNGYGYAIESDSFGVTKSAMSCESAYKSTPTSGIVTGRPDSADSVKVLAENGEAYGLSNGRCGPAYHIFFAQPAADLPTSAQLADGTTVFVKPDIETPEILVTGALSSNIGRPTRLLARAPTFFCAVDGRSVMSSTASAGHRRGWPSDEAIPPDRAAADVGAPRRSMAVAPPPEAQQGDELNSVVPRRGSPAVDRVSPRRGALDAAGGGALRAAPRRGDSGDPAPLHPRVLA